MSMGAILGLLVLVAAFVLFLVGRLDGEQAGLLGALGVAILLSPLPARWPGQS